MGRRGGGHDGAGDGRAGAPSEPASLRRAWWSLAIAASAAIVIAFNVTATNIAFPEISEDFSEVSQATLSWAISGYSIGLAAFLLVGGRVADRSGRRRVFLAGCAGLAVASVLTAFAPTAPVFLVMRFLQAVGGAFALPASTGHGAARLPHLPPGPGGVDLVGVELDRGRAGPHDLRASSSTPSSGGRCTSWASVLVVVIVLGPRLLPESRAERVSGRLDWLGVAVGTLAVAATVFSVSQGASLGWASPWVVGGIVTALVLMPDVRLALPHPSRTPARPGRVRHAARCGRPT